MNNSGKIIGGVLAVAGVATLLLATKRGKKITKSVTAELHKYLEDAGETVDEKRDQFRKATADKVFDFAVNNRQTIAQIASAVAPYLLKNFVKKKL